MFLDKPEMRKYSKLLELSNIELPIVKMQLTSKSNEHLISLSVIKYQSGFQLTIEILDKY